MFPSTSRRSGTCGLGRPLLAVAAITILAACQGMDRLEPDRLSSTDAAERGTLLNGSSEPALGTGGRLTNEIAMRRLRQIEAAPSEQRLKLAEQFLDEYPSTEMYPGADSISYLHELMGDAYSELGRPGPAADAWERAIATSWPQPDLLGLPLTNVELPFQVGWARYEAGDAARGADWLVRATFIDDRPQLAQGLRFLYAELGAPGEGFDAWLAARRAGLAVPAPDFELPGYGFDSLALSQQVAKEGVRLTLVDFWTPT